MDNDKLSNFIEGITDAIKGRVNPFALARQEFVGYAEGVDAAQAVDFDPADYDAEDLFARYFG